MDIKYLGLKMFDVPQTNIKKFFDTSTKFIETALASGGINMKQYIGNVCYRKRKSSGSLFNGDVKERHFSDSIPNEVKKQICIGGI